ncbi:MAG: molybdopterin molybdotransferase MoeA [Anaerolineales bacterium]|nr:molybdopterin molybdotransferase MoeA [Anaerolineales bacterium]MCB8965908.1 molybdopterin molybdotransferase MoeA [Ardenticatenaceae bacterium]
MISYEKAYRLTLERIEALEAEEVPLLAAVGRVAAQNLVGKVESPSVDVSLKDGYAIHSADIVDASKETAVPLRLVGTVAAGGHWLRQVHLGEAVRILSGAPIPKGADAVVAEEFTQRFGDTILVNNDAYPGRNILPQGSDVHRGELLVRKGIQLTPPTVGLLAAAGHQSVPVVATPKVAIVATGDEVVAPGEMLQPGKLYASNLVTLAAWCVRYGSTVKTFVVRDDADLLRKELVTCLRDYDAVLTSGGAWSGERDLVVRLLDELGWHKAYHRVRLGPGKAVAFGVCAGKPVFCLPGGPPSNHMAFLQLALPGLQKMGGWRTPGLPTQQMRLGETIESQQDWTKCVYGRLEKTAELPTFYPLNPPSRLQMIAAAEAIIKIPEGQTVVEQGQIVEGQVLQS